MKRTKDPAKEAEYRKRATDLVAQMTLHEKVSQMLSWAPAIERLGIPAYNWWSEGIHGIGRAGTATVFPQAIGMAAAFDEDMMEQVGNAVGVGARSIENRHALKRILGAGNIVCSGASAGHRHNALRQAEFMHIGRAHQYALRLLRLSGNTVFLL